MSGELVHLELAFVHPNYRGSSRRELASALRVDLSEAPLDVLVAISWLLGEPSACVQRTPGSELRAETRDVVFEVVEDAGLDFPGLPEQVQEVRRNATLPLLRVVQSRRDRIR